MNIFEKLWFKAKTGATITDLSRVDEVIIRYKDKLISVMEDPDSGELKSLGWMMDTEMHTQVPIREFWRASPPKLPKKEV